ncbi:MAG: site-2 protease family protein [Snowella sp.]|nr:site-2 protease family protein [Snowella sp.]
MGQQRQLGSIFGIPFYLDSSWFLILGLVTLVNANQINEEILFGNRLWLGWLLGLILALGLFGSVLLHELGHSLVARSQGIKVNSITLFLFGGVASIERESTTPVGSLWVAIAGPLVSFALAGLFSILGTLLPNSELWVHFSDDLGNINFFLGVFNLIPGLPLDGGQVLKSVIWKATGDRLVGMRWAARSGKALGIVGFGLGLLLMLTFGNFGGAWLALIGWFVWKNASAYDRLADLQTSLLTLKAVDVMTRDFRVIDANLTLKDFAQTYLLSHDGLNFPYYAASEGRYRGLIRPEKLQEIERSQWDHLTLNDIAEALTDIPTVAETTSLATVVNQLEGYGGQPAERFLTVLSPADAIAGVIDRGDIVKVLTLKHRLPISDTEIQRTKTEFTYPNAFAIASLAKNLTPQELTQ